MSIEIAVTLIILAFMSGAAGVFVAYRFFARIERRLIALEKAEDLRNQLLEDSRGRQKGHHSYNTLAAVQDAMAVLLDAGMDAKALMDRLETVAAIMSIIQSGPYEYDPDKGMKK